MLDSQIFEVLEVKHQHIGRGGSSVQTKIKNLATGQVLSRNFKPSDSFKEADIEKKKIIFLYSHRGEIVFANPENKSRRFNVNADIAGNIVKWLKPNTECDAVFLNEKIISIKPPIKIDLKVVSAPPGVKGNRAQAGTKSVKLESGAEINVPLFIGEGDAIRVNTQTEEYVERSEKA